MSEKLKVDTFIFIYLFLVQPNVTIFDSFCSMSYLELEHGQ